MHTLSLQELKQQQQKLRSAYTQCFSHNSLPNLACPSPLQTLSTSLQGKGAPGPGRAPVQSIPLPATEHVGHFGSWTIQNKVAKISLVKGAIAQVCTFPRRSSAPGGESEGLLQILIHPWGVDFPPSKEATHTAHMQQAGGATPYTALCTQTLFSL